MLNDALTRKWTATTEHLSWEAGSIPTMPQPSDRTVSVLHCGICGSDLAKLANSPYQVHPSGSWTPGHEIVVHDHNGQPAAIDPLIPCLRCPHCTLGDTHLCPNLKRIGWDQPGGFATHVTVPATNVIPIHPTLSETAVLADTIATAVHALHCTRSRTTTGSLAVVGTGPLAVATVNVARQQGWNSIATIGRHRNRLQTIAPFVETDLALTGTLPSGAFDLVVDAASGDTSAPLEEALRIVRSGGEILVLNAYQPGQRLTTPLRSVFSRSITITGCYSHCRRRGGDFLHALRLLHTRPQWAEKLVGHRFPMSDLPRALTEHTESPVIKTILTNEVNPR